MKHNITLEFDFDEPVTAHAAEYIAKTLLERVGKLSVYVGEEPTYVTNMKVASVHGPLTPSGLEILGVKVDAEFYVRPDGDKIHFSEDQYFSEYLALPREKIGALIDALRMLC